MAIKFGSSQLKNPTPSKINMWVRVYTVVAAIFLGWMATVNFFGPNTKDLLNGVIGLTLALCNGVAPMFGIELNSVNYVKAEDVTAIDTDNKN